MTPIVELPLGVEALHDADQQQGSEWEQSTRAQSSRLFHFLHGPGRFLRTLILDIKLLGHMGSLATRGLNGEKPILAPAGHR